MKRACDETGRGHHPHGLSFPEGHREVTIDGDLQAKVQTESCVGLHQESLVFLACLMLVSAVL